MAILRSAARGEEGLSADRWVPKIGGCATRPAPRDCAPTSGGTFNARTRGQAIVVNVPARARWLGAVGLAGLMSLAAEPAHAGPLKRYQGTPVAAPEAADPVVEGTMAGLERSLAGNRWPGMSARRKLAGSNAARAPHAPLAAALSEPAPASPGSAGAMRPGARSVRTIVAGLMTASMVLLGLLLLKRHRDRTVASSLVRYAISYPHADARAN